MRVVKGSNRRNSDGRDSRSCSNDLGQCGTGLYDEHGVVASGGYVGTVRESGETTALVVGERVLAYGLLSGRKQTGQDGNWVPL